MKRTKLTGKILGIALTFVLVGAVLPFSGFVSQNRALAQPVPIPASLELLGAGAKWASQTSGGTALYVNWQDNLYLHPNPEYEDPIPTEPNSGDSISYILETYGFDVEFAGDIPVDLSEYSIVVITAYWAVEPANEPVIRSYISDGGGVVLTGGVPSYFVTYCKDWWPGIGNLAPIQDWFGAGWLTNTGGYAQVTIDNPFGTLLVEGDILVEGLGYSCAAILQLQPSAEIIAEWGTGHIFSFAYETTGRLYYQSVCEELSSIPDIVPPTVSNVSPEDGASNVAIGTNVTAAFSEVMDGSTINASTFTLEGSAVSGTVTYNPSTYTATFTPDANLDYNHTYTATLSTAITDLVGNPLAESYTWSFTTESAPADTTRPAAVTDLRTVHITASGFVYPTGESGPYTYAGWLAGSSGMPPYQEGYYHLGQDMEASEGNDVYAIADGEIVYVSASGWGEENYGLLVKHGLNTGEEFLALYGHVRPNREDLRYAASGPVNPSVPVTVGGAFATIGPYGSIPHLHFGIHPGAEMPPSPWGRMPLDQWPDTNGFVDPLDWITERTPFSPLDPTSSIMLAWTAPGDDGNVGTATTYDIRYSTSEITETNWDSATQCVGEPTPNPAGSTETYTVTDLSPGTTYYFAFKTADEVPNWSPLSNVVSVTTTPALLRVWCQSGGAFLAYFEKDESLSTDELIIGDVCVQNTAGTWYEVTRYDNMSIKEQDIPIVFPMGPFQTRIFHDVVFQEGEHLNFECSRATPVAWGILAIDMISRGCFGQAVPNDLGSLLTKQMFNSLAYQYSEWIYLVNAGNALAAGDIEGAIVEAVHFVTQTKAAKTLVLNLLKKAGIEGAKQYIKTLIDLVLFHKHIELLTELSDWTFAAPVDGLAHFDCHR